MIVVDLMFEALESCRNFLTRVIDRGRKIEADVTEYLVGPSRWES